MANVNIKRQLHRRDRPGPEALYIEQGPVIGQRGQQEIRLNQPGYYDDSAGDSSGVREQILRMLLGDSQSELSVNDILDVKQRVVTPRELAGKRGISEEQIYTMHPELREWRPSPAPNSPQPQPETPPQQSGRQQLLEALTQPPERARLPHPAHGMFPG